MTSVRLARLRSQVPPSTASTQATWVRGLGNVLALNSPGPIQRVPLKLSGRVPDRSFKQPMGVKMMLSAFAAPAVKVPSIARTLAGLSQAGRSSGAPLQSSSRSLPQTSGIGLFNDTQVAVLPPSQTSVPTAQGQNCPLTVHAATHM